MAASHSSKFTQFFLNKPADTSSRVDRNAGKAMKKRQGSVEIYTWQWQSYRCSRPRFLVLRRAPLPVSARPSQQQHGQTPPGTSCTTTCNACKVTIHHHQAPGPLLRVTCPFCGQPYSTTEPICATPNTDPFADSGGSAGQQGGGVGVGAGRLRDDRTLGDHALLRLPVIQNDHSPEHRENNYLVRPLGDVSISRLLVPPGPESPLPPIHQDGRRVSHEGRRGSQSEGRRGSQTPSSPELDSSRVRSPLSVATLTLSDIEPPCYPVRNKTREEFLQDVRRAHQMENYTSVQRFYMRCFDSFAEICSTFKVDRDQNGANPEDPELKMDFVYAVHDTLRGMPSFIHKTVLKSIINALLEEDRVLYDKDLVRAYFVLTQNPVFASQSSYTIFAHLLRQIVELPTTDHQLLVHWFKTLEVGKLRMILRHILQFITIRHFPPADKSLPPLGKCRWWIPTGTKALALINAANNACNPALLHYSEFYNSALDHIDLMQDYFNWQSPQRPGQFAYCQYPFILSIVAKRIILTKDSEQQMILTARRSLVAKVARHQPPQIDIFFLNIHVRRSHLVSDSLNEISVKHKDLKKKLKVSFVGEPGLDMGGLTKEWFLLLIRRIFHPDYGMFVFHPHSRSYWFSTDQEGNLREYNLIGVLMGLAVYNSIILDLHFPSVCYRKLLSPPVVPAVDTSGVGVVRHPTIEDLAEIMPEVAKGLGELLNYEGNVEEDMCMNFQVSLEEYGDVKTCQLKDNGENVPVTNDNREEYVQLYLNWILNAAVYHQFRAFYLGFHSVCASNALIMLRPEEVEMLVCGSPNLDLNELRKVTEYDGYKADDPVILEFWDVLHSLSDELKKKFLLFTTGSDRVPVGGMGEMTFKVTRVTNKPDNLPEAHTCFNQLVLPHYESKGVLREKLIIAISNAEGFGLE